MAGFLRRLLRPRRHETGVSLEEYAIYLETSHWRSAPQPNITRARVIPRLFPLDIKRQPGMDRKLGIEILAGATFNFSLLHQDNPFMGQYIAIHLDTGKNGCDNEKNDNGDKNRHGNIDFPVHESQQKQAHGQYI